MSNEEAINILQEHIKTLVSYEYNDDLLNALIDAIKALENEKPKVGWVKKEDVIHHIAKQYSAHNEVVPIWLNIGYLRSEER